MENEYGVKVFDGVESIYFATGVKKAPNSFIEGGDISDGARTFTGATLSSDNYAERIHDIYILSRRAKQKGPPHTAAEKFALRSELGGLIRICRISRPVALYASVSAQTCETIDASIVNWSDFAEVPPTYV